MLRSNPSEMVHAVESDSRALVEVIEIKWLLAGEGFHLHVERLQTDREYAREVLDRAAHSRNPALRETAMRLRARFDLADD